MILVTKEPKPEYPLELCCFCRAPTPYWFLPKDVACCQGCAARANEKDVPSKDVWIRREHIAGRTRTTI